MRHRAMIAFVLGLFASLGFLDRGSAQDNTRLEVVLAEAVRLDELRVKTDKTRVVDGDTQPVYELRKPGKGNIFVNARLYLSSDAPFTLSREEIHLAAPGIEGIIHPFDWFHEDGLIERRGTSVTINAMGILNMTAEVPEATAASYFLFVKGDLVAPLSEALETGGRIEAMAPGATVTERPSIEIVIADVKELVELRVKTDKTRVVDGDTQPVYELRKPGAGNAFLNLRLYLSGTSGFTLTREDIRLTDPDGKTYLPFDWFHEDGLIERRGTSVTFSAMGILNFATEIPRNVKDSLTLSVMGTHAGALPPVGAPPNPGNPPSAGTPSTPPSSPKSGTPASGASFLEILVAETDELVELRVKTDKTRVVEGETQPVYELRKPGNGNTFLAVRVYVTGKGPISFRREDMKVALANGEPCYPFDWFQEVGLHEVRGDVVVVDTQGILNFTIEMPVKEKATARLAVAGQDLGAIADLAP